LLLCWLCFRNPEREAAAGGGTAGRFGSAVESLAIVVVDGMVS
jgi:hypothetical protein